MQCGDCFTASCFCNVFDTCDEISHFAGPELRQWLWSWLTCTNLNCIVRGAGLHELQATACCHAALHHANTRDNAAVLVELRVEDERLQRRIDVALWCGDLFNDLVQQLRHSGTCLCRDTQDVFCRNTQDVLDLLGIAVRVCCGQVDLVQHRDNLKIVLKGQVTVCKSLRFDALSGIHYQHHAFACSE